MGFLLVHSVWKYLVLLIPRDPECRANNKKQHLSPLPLLCLFNLFHALWHSGHMTPSSPYQEVKGKNQGTKQMSSQQQYWQWFFWFWLIWVEASGTQVSFSHSLIDFRVRSREKNLSMDIYNLMCSCCVCCGCKISAAAGLFVFIIVFRPWYSIYTRSKQ